MRRKIPLAVFLVYLALSWALREFLPFSSFSMFAQTQKEAASLVFSADGAPADLLVFTDFSLNLPDQDSLGPNISGVNRTLSLDEAYSYIRSHQAPRSAPGPVPVEFALNTTAWNPGTGIVSSSRRVLSSGRARRIR